MFIYNPADYTHAHMHTQLRLRPYRSDSSVFLCRQVIGVDLWSCSSIRPLQCDSATASRPQVAYGGC